MRDKETFDAICNTADGVFIVDAQKRILRWNGAAEKILGRTEADVVHRECYTVLCGKTRTDRRHCGRNCKIHSGALSGTPQKNFDLLTETGAGRPVWLNVSVFSPVDGKDPFLAHVIRDVTRSRTRELALDQFLACLDACGYGSAGKSQAKHPAELTAPVSYAAPDKAAALSDREVEVLTLLADGFSTKLLAQKLDISHFTARNHIQNILVKLDLHSKAEAVSFAFRKGIL